MCGMPYSVVRIVTSYFGLAATAVGTSVARTAAPATSRAVRRRGTVTPDGGRTLRAGGRVSRGADLTRGLTRLTAERAVSDARRPGAYAVGVGEGVGEGVGLGVALGGGVGSGPTCQVKLALPVCTPRPSQPAE